MNAVSTVAQLLASRCESRKHQSPLSPDAVARQLQALPEWTSRGDAIEREFTFPDYRRTIAFVNAVADLAENEDHHPELTVGYGKVRVSYGTHDVGGISMNDFICAAKTDAIYAP